MKFVPKAIVFYITVFVAFTVLLVSCETEQLGTENNDHETIPLSSNEEKLSAVIDKVINAEKDNKTDG